MCGIVGYIGNNQAPSILIDGLSKLEYRGYDSAGVAVHDGENINILKTKGRLSNLVKLVIENPLTGTLGIGHTRWATHGVPSDVNAPSAYQQRQYDSRCSQRHNRKLCRYKK